MNDYGSDSVTSGPNLTCSYDQCMRIGVNSESLTVENMSKQLGENLHTGGGMLPSKRARFDPIADYNGINGSDVQYNNFKKENLYASCSHQSMEQNPVNLRGREPLRDSSERGKEREHDLVESQTGTMEEGRVLDAFNECGVTNISQECNTNRRLSAFIHMTLENPSKGFSDGLNYGKYHCTGQNEDEEYLGKNIESEHSRETKDNEGDQGEPKESEAINLNFAVDVEEEEERVVEVCASIRSFEGQHIEVLGDHDNVSGENTNMILLNQGKACLGIQQEVLEEQNTGVQEKSICELDVNRIGKSEDSEKGENHW